VHVLNANNYGKYKCNTYSNQSSADINIYNEQLYNTAEINIILKIAHNIICVLIVHALHEKRLIAIRIAF
jgi:hypothetical protein